MTLDELCENVRKLKASFDTDVVIKGNGGFRYLDIERISLELNDENKLIVVLE